jgi:two-component system chemotaxis response regulator CheB
VGPTRDVIVIGASAGGVQALGELVAGLPPDLPAAVLVALHTAPHHPSSLPEILTRRGPLPATLGVHGEEIVPGRIYVAPPDNHLLVRRGVLDVVRGPKENGYRPSVDALFRSASAAYGARVIGVVLSGYLDCGTSGMLSIKARGGIAVVQSPEDAGAPEMPRSAIAHVPIDHVAPVRLLPSLLSRLVRERATDGRPSPVELAVRTLEGDEPGAPAGVVCPLCQGALTLSEQRGFQQYRCHVGHTFSLESLGLEQAEALERALWAAARALEESASVLRRAGAVAASDDLRRRLGEREAAQLRDAEVIREILLGGSVLAPADVPSGEPSPTVGETEPVRGDHAP